MEEQGRRRETSRHRSPSRLALLRPAGRAAVVLPPFTSLLPALLLLVAVQATSPVAQRPPSGESGADLAGAWLATSPGALGGVTPWTVAPLLGRLQLGWLLHLLQGGSGQSVLAAAHGAMLLLAVLQATLLWWLLRRLGAGGVAAGLATAVFGAAPVAVAAHSAVSAIAVAVVWLLLAAALAAGRRTPARVAGGALGVVAIASAPVVLLAAVPLVVLLLLRLRREPPRAVVAVGAGAGSAAVVLLAAATVLALLPRTAAAARLDALDAAAPLRAAGGAGAWRLWVETDPVSLLVGLGAVVLALVAARARGVAVVAAVLGLAAVWPLGGAATSAIVLLLPVVAVAVARAVDLGVAALGHPLFVRSVLGSAWLTAVGAVLVVAVVAWLVGLGAPARGGDRPIARVARWTATSVPAGQVVLVPLGAWADVAATARADVGWYTADGDTAGAPGWSRATYVVVDAALADRPSGAAARVLGRSSRVAVFGVGADRLVVRAVRAPADQASPPDPSTPAGREALRVRRAVGAQLAKNPRVELNGTDRARLLQGEVDARIAIVLAQFVTAHSIAISGFGLAPGDASGVRSSVTISEVDGRRVPGDGTKTGVLLRFLSDLRGGFATRSIDATDDGITAAFDPDPDLALSGSTGTAPG